MKNHWKSNHNLDRDAWKCSLDNCRVKQFESETQRCRKDRKYLRIEDKKRHETQEQYDERNREKINASLTCQHCGKKFRHRPTKIRHQGQCKLDS